MTVVDMNVINTNIIYKGCRSQDVSYYNHENIGIELDAG